MRYGSVCSGIEAASVAFRPLGWECAFVSEIEPFASAVLAARWPGVPNLGDFTKIGAGSFDGGIDLLVGGTPCQAFSRAGLRRGIEDERGNLALEFVGLVRRLEPKWVVWENVPGVLTSGGGRDFASFLSRLAGWDVSAPEGGWRSVGIVTGAPGGYGLAWRVLDARRVRTSGFPGGIAQRRKRVILVAFHGSWRRAAQVLALGAPCIFDTAQCEEVPALAAGAACAGCSREDCEPIPLDMTSLDGRNKRSYGKCYDAPGSAAYTITRRRPSGVCQCGVARYLTPVECERLFGLPENYTRVSWRGRPEEKCPDGPRYKALGNSMCVNVMAWVAGRIDAEEKGVAA